MSVDEGRQCLEAGGVALYITLHGGVGDGTLGGGEEGRERVCGARLGRGEAR